jgi:sulfite exporter TauE/SafE
MIFAISPAERHPPSENASGMPVEGADRVSLLSPDSLLVGAAAGASFLTGLGGSGHCALMCGPLACVGLDRDPRSRRRASVAWHAGRAAAYTLVGALLGTLGHAGLAVTRAPLARALPWLMVVGLVLSAAEVGRRLPALPGLSRVARALTVSGARLSPVARAALRGAATPFLPCGLLYGAFVVAIGTGSALSGATVMFAFALGALPALALVQAGAPRLATGATAAPIVRRAVPLVAAALVAWRAAGAHGAGPPHCH